MNKLGGARFSIILLTLILFSIALAAYDDTQAECEGGGYTWFSGTITGSNGPCCGDDGLADTFYNGSIGSTTYFCQNGSFINQAIDSNQTLCGYYGYKWIFDTNIIYNPLINPDAETGVLSPWLNDLVNNSWTMLANDSYGDCHSGEWCFASR